MSAGAVSASSLAGYFCARGLACDIEAGPHGVIVYASTRESVSRIGSEILRAVRPHDPKARMPEAPRHDSDEPEATAWWVAVDLDWARLQVVGTSAGVCGGGGAP